MYTALYKSCTLHILNTKDEYLLSDECFILWDVQLRCMERDGVEEPVAFYSRQLRDVETRYSATALECLAVIESVRHFELYLDGRHFNIQTDQRALEYLKSPTPANKRLCRWALRLQGLDFTIKYRPGRSIGKADAVLKQAWTRTTAEDGH